MAQRKQEIKNIKFTDLTADIWYEVKKSGFKRVTPRGKTPFMSAWFLVKMPESDDVVFVSTMRESDAFKYIGLTQTRTQEDIKSALNVVKIKRVEYKEYSNIEFLVREWNELQDTEEITNEEIPF